MPYRLDTLGGRVIVLGSILAGLMVFGLWFVGLGPFVGRPGTDPRQNAPEGVPLTHLGGNPAAPSVHYPALDEEPPAARPLLRVATPDFDPLVHATGGPSTSRPLLHLLRLLPEGTSVLGMVRLDALRRQGWAADVLLGRKLPSLRTRLTPLGLDLREETRAVLGVELEARAAPAPAEGPDLRFLGKRDRPFVLIVEGPSDRKELLQQFRRVGPLAATEILGRRVYRRSGDFAMTFPVRGLVAWTYRRPMGPLLLNLLDTPTRGAMTPEVWQILEESGLTSPPPAPSEPPPAASGGPGRPPPGAVDPRGTTRPSVEPGEAHQPPGRPAQDSARPAPKGPGTPRAPAAATPDPDAKLPWITLLWTPRPGQRPPYPLKSVAGYGPKPSLRGALVTLGPGASGGALLELRLFYRDAQSPVQMAALLRYARRHVAQWPRVRRALLTDLVDAVPIQAQGDQIVVTVALQAWHLRALHVLFHKLLEGEG